MKSTLEAMKIALDMEKKGYQAYLDAAHKTLNKLGRSTLEAIAAQELEHIKAIEGYCQRPEADPEAARMIGRIKHSEKKDYIRGIVAKIGDQLNDKVAAADPNLSETYKTAMELERESYVFYKNLSQEAGVPSVKAFFQFMMEQENTHFELFQETLEYLDRPGDWFREQERWIVEGG
jgi:rubrerythrin